LRVVELASVLAGPATGQFFAELGADVVKVEPPVYGDVTRSWRTPWETQETSAYFSAVNWGKRSIALDLRDDGDRSILDALMKKADLVITSFRPGADRELGLDYTSISRVNPVIIHGQITGYGEDDPRVGYDALLQAESGFMHLNGQVAGKPQKMPVALVDLLAAHQLKEAMLVAMIRKIRTGEGAHVTVSLLDAAISSLANQAANYLVGGRDPQPAGSLHPNIAPYGEVVSTRDHKQVILAIGNNRQFQALARFQGLETLENDPRFSDNSLRVKNRHTLFPLLSKGISRATLEEFLAYCRQHHIPVGEISTVGQALEANPSLHLHAETLRGIRNFVAHGLTVESALRRPPQLNEHYSGILKDWL